MDELLNSVKLALRITTDAFNGEITALINAALADLGIAGVDLDTVGESYLTNPLIINAVITYAKINFGQVETDVYNRLKASYDEQKAQLSMATGFTVWTAAE
jgi:hypothetical protein